MGSILSINVRENGKDLSCEECELWAYTYASKGEREGNEKLLRMHSPTLQGCKRFNFVNKTEHL